MWPRNVDMVGALDLSEPELPPRSRLFALKPLGVGTDRVESLTSYLTRLANAHAVSPRRLIREALVRDSPDAGLRRAARYVYQLNTLDGLDRYAAGFVTLISKMTSVREVRYLTLLSLSNVLPQFGIGVMAQHPRWCPDCLQEQRAAGADITRLLVWSLDLYQVCHRHRRALMSACPKCGESQPFIPCFPDVSRCTSCGADLAAEVKALRPPINEMNMWMADALADLTAKLPLLDGMADRANFVTFLKRALAEAGGGNKASLCRRLGWRRSALDNWVLRDARPSLPQLLAVAYGLGVLPSDVLQPNTRPPFVVRPLPGKVHKRNAGRRLKSLEREAIGRQLHDIVADPNDVRPLREVAKSMGLSRWCLVYWFPEHCAVIHSKNAAYRKQLADERRLADYQKVKDVVDAFRSDGRYPGRRKVNEALRLHRVSLSRRDLIDVYRAATLKKGVHGPRSQ